MFFVFMMLYCTLALFPGHAAAAWADAPPSAVAQVGDNTYASLQAAIQHVDDDGSTITLLTDVTESIDFTLPDDADTAILNLDGHTLAASGGPAISIPADTTLTITGSGTVAGGTESAILCWGTLIVENGTFTSSHTLMQFGEDSEGTAEAYLEHGTFSAPTIVERVGAADYLGYVQIGGGMFHGTFPAGLDTLEILHGSFSDISNLTSYLQLATGLAQTENGMYETTALRIISDIPQLELTASADTPEFTASSLLEQTGTRLNALADYRLDVDEVQLATLNKQISLAAQAVQGGTAFAGANQDVDITAARIISEEMQSRTATEDHIAAKVNVIIKPVEVPAQPEEPEEPANPGQPEEPTTPPAKPSETPKETPAAPSQQSISRSMPKTGIVTLPMILAAMLLLSATAIVAVIRALISRRRLR
mgnify:FL=1